MGDHIFSSMSKSSVEVTKINLSPERQNDYRTSYLFDKSPRGRNKVFVDIPKMVEALTIQSKRVNALFSLCNFIVANGGMLQDLETSEGSTALYEHINHIAEVMTMELSEEALSIKDTKAENKDQKQAQDEYKKRLKSVFDRMNSGKMLIVDSKVHPNGKDIYFNGDHGASGADWGRKEGLETVQLVRGSDQNYSKRYNWDYTTPLSLKIVEVAKKFRDDVLGGGDIENVHKRQYRTFPLNYNFEKWRSRFERAGLILKSDIMARMLRNIDLTEREVKNLNGFMSGCVTTDPSNSIYTVNSPWYKYISRRDEFQDESAERPKNEEHFCPIGAALEKNFSFSLCLHIPEDIVNFITQTEDSNGQLYKLSTWAKSWSSVYIRPKHGKSDGGTKKVPPFILSPSILPQLAEERKAAGLPVVNKIGDEHNIAVNPNGELIYLPAKDDFDPRQSEKHEHLNEDILRICFENGIPTQESKDITSNISMAYRISSEDRNNAVNDSINGIREQLKSYEGQLLGYDLDFGILVYAGQNYSDIRTVRLNGTTTPEALSIADYLGYDFSGEGESPNFKSFRKSVVRLMHRMVTKEMDPVAIERGQYFNACITPLLRTYLYLSEEDSQKYPRLQELIHRAFKDLNIEDLREDELNNMQGYLRFVNEKGNLVMRESPATFIQVVTSLYGTAEQNASASDFNSRLFQILLKEFDNNIDTVRAELPEDPRYFNERSSTMAKYGNMYHHLGGRILLYICEALANTAPNILLAPRFNAELEAFNIEFPSYRMLSMTVMPMAVMLSKYVPEALRYFEEAEHTTESLAKQEGFQADDMKLPGLAEGTQLFPHQLDSMATLQNCPKFAILDISPGGGKTILGVMDIINLIGQGKKVRPLVIAPDHLVTNWCDDMYKVTKGTWNVIPLSSKSTTGTWEDEEIDQVLEDAPINTICVAGINWIKNHHRKTTIAIGDRAVSMPERVDLLRKHNFNYIMLDESHKAKKYEPGKNVSGVHDALKMVTTYFKVDYVRLATGTLVPDKVKDIVGQVNLFTASVFGTPEYLEMDVDLEKRDDAPFLVRSKLAQHVALITKKRKDWAFMLPNPIDNFITCVFGTVAVGDQTVSAESENIDMESLSNQQKGDVLHYTVYQAVLNDTINAMEEEMGKKKKGGDDDDDDDSSDVDNEEGGYSSGDDGTVDTDEAGNEIAGAMTATAMGIHLQRLEQLLTDPWGDEAFKAQAKVVGLKRKGFVPVKIRTVIQRLDNHFKHVQYDPTKVMSAHRGVIKWERGMQHRELDLVSHDGVTYMARNLEGEEGSAGRSMYPTTSDVPPPQDPDRWKKERTGKVLIFCRYTRTVEAVFKALPDRYKNVARRFHGKLGEFANEDKWRNLEEFRANGDDKVQILVANEQAITEGQNLQIASRIIRVEAPWSPGDYEQATARIFRPDVAAAQLDEDGKPGDMAREVIFIDWIMADGTLEVPKVGRLVAKTIETTKFAEKGNPRYADLPKLKPIPMGLPMLREIQTYDEIEDYFAAKAQLNDIEQKEFWEMRKTTVAAMIPIEGEDPHPDFRKINCAPVSPNVVVKDDQFKYTRYTDWCQQHKDTVMSLRGDGFRGLPVRTPFGLGMIVGVTAMRLIPDPAGTLDPKTGKVRRVPDIGNPVSNFRIRLADNSKGNFKYKPGDMFVVSPTMCHIAEDVSREDFDTHFKSSKTWSTATERKAAEREAAKAAAAAKAEREERDAKEREIQKKVEAEKRKVARAQQRIKNQKENKPINDGVEEAVARMPKNEVAGKNIDMRVKIHVGVYNGFFGLVGELSDPDLHSFDKEFDFIDFGSYIYIDLKTYNDFDALADWLDSRETKKGGSWVLDPNTTLKNLKPVVDVFDQKNRDKFSQKLAMKPQQQLTMFLRKKLRKLTGKGADKKIRLYPIIMHDRVRICMDVATSPKAAEAFMRYSAIKGHKGFAGQTAGKWQRAEGMTIFFCATKTEAKRKLAQIQKGGYKIRNGKTVLNNLERLKPMRARDHKL